MKVSIPCLFFLLTVISVATASASEKVSVQASPDFRVALVGGEKSTMSEKACHQALGSCFADDMSARFGGEVKVKLVQLEAGRAAADLAAGIYDAVLVVGETLPTQLHKADFVVNRGVSEVGVPVRVFQLVVRNDNPGFQTKVVASFEKALMAPRFQQALSHAATMKVTANTR